MDQRYVCNIQGRVYLKYGGVLAEALAQGLTRLEVELIQIPSEANGNTAICKATAVITQEGIARTFVEYGDAAPNNCAKMVQTALIRMASTRAKGRALRDAIGHGEALAEEIGEADSGAVAPPGYQPQQEASPVIRDQFCSAAGCGVELTPGQVKLSQAKFQRSLCPDHQRAAA